MIDELVASARITAREGTVYRVEIPCALYASVTGPEELREALMHVFGEAERHEVSLSGDPWGTVFYPGWGKEVVGIADVEEE